MTADEIVAVLAQTDPVAADEINGDLYCTLCGAQGHLDTIEDHADGCPWAAAVRLTRS